MKQRILCTKLMKKVSFYLLIILISVSCSSVKRLSENEHLLKKNTIYVDQKKNTNRALNDYLIQKPNSRVLWLPISLYFHNLGNPKNPKTPKEWGMKNPKTYRFFKEMFSEKQSISFANTSIGLNNWFLKNGEAPVIINDKKNRRTANNLSAYFMTQGYFKNTVVIKKDTFSNKKGEITYYITSGKPLFLDSITNLIASPILDSIYKTDTEKTFLKSGDQYNDQNFRKEAARITKLYRNTGIYNFSGNEDVMFFQADSTRTDHKTAIQLTISNNYIVEENGKYISKPFAIKKISNVRVYTDYTYNTKEDVYLDTIRYNDIHFIAHKKVTYNPKYLSQSIFIKPNQIYSDTLRDLTRTHLRSLKNFKAVNIRYIEKENNELEALIYLTPNEKFTISAETEITHSNIRKLGVSGKFSIVNKNTFKGTEIFKFSFLGSFFNTSAEAGSSSDFFNAWEIGVDLSLEIPRFVAPFGISEWVPKSMSPKTVFSIGTGIQKNIGLDKQTITAIVDYKWKFNNKKTIHLELFNAQYIRNLNRGHYFNIYNSEFEKLQRIEQMYPSNLGFQLTRNNAVTFMKLINADTNFQASNPTAYKENANVNNRHAIITSNFIIPTIAYSYNYNSQTNYKDNTFSSFKVRIANSGNFFALLSNQKNSNGIKTIQDTPVAQYFKTDIEYKQFWDISSRSVLGFRSFLGIVVPYGDSGIPFTKSYFAGGSNDIRAWQIYDLGPGSTTPELEYNVGNFKFLTSLEYRFDLIGNVKGALFIDAGNIWDITNSSFTDSDAKFNGLSSLKQIAVGSGFGIRYDLNFLVLRFDYGFKTYEPYLPKDQKWFSNYTFKQGVFNVGINYPF